MEIITTYLHCFDIPTRYNLYSNIKASKFSVQASDEQTADDESDDQADDDSSDIPTSALPKGHYTGWRVS